MSIDETLLTLALELAEEWDPTLDTSVGSSFRTQFLNPLLTRVGESPLEVDLETFFVERLEEEIEDIDVSPFSGLRDLAIRAYTVMSEPLRREIRGVKLTQSLNNYQTMTREELNALLGNYFTSLQAGQISTGTVRMFFPSPQSVIVTPLTQFSSGDGLNFFPTVAQSISSTQMAFNASGDLFYFDVLVQAESAGETYNVAAGDVNTVVGISGALRVSNLTRFQNGLAEETKEEAVARTLNSITIRNLITDRGVKFVLPENFPAVDTIQVIGFGDDEMLRDVIKGPTTISDVPGGIIGDANPDLALGQEVHIGGKTDVYIYQETPDVADLDIENLTDKGYRIFRSAHGYTAAGGGTTLDFQDNFGFFDKRGVGAGDILLVGQYSYTVDDVTESVPLSGTFDTLTVTPVGAAPDFPGGLFEQTYEIVRRETGFLTIPLYDLVAEDASGTPVTDDDGDPVAPVPGSLEPLFDGGGVEVKKTENKASANISLPLLRVDIVDRLDSLTLEESGDIFPMAHPVLIEALSDFVDAPTGLDRATGTVRIYFRDRVNAWVSSSAGGTAFNFQAATGELAGYRPVAKDSSVDVGENVRSDIGSDPNLLFIDNVDATSSFNKGYRIEIPGAGVTLTVVAAEYSPPFSIDNTVLEVRETITADFSNQPWQAHLGVTETELPGTGDNRMPFDEDLQLHYFDVALEAALTGPIAPAVPVAGESLTANNLYSEGWFLRTTRSVLSYSTKELPYLQLSVWQNDTRDLSDTLTAFAARLNYEHAASLVAIQEFSEDVANRIVAEDVLIRHFTPAYVRTKLSVRAITADTAFDTATGFINALDPTDDLEVSDVSDSLYNVGATKVVMPVTLVALAQARDRTWTAHIDQDAVDSSRIQHFVADRPFIIVDDSA
jgi:hypothetical protein